MQIRLDGWNPRAPRFFQPHGSFTRGTETCCLLHPWVNNDLHAFAGHTGLHALQIKAADRTRLFRRVRYAHDLGKAGHIIGQTVRDLVKTCARLNIHILREAAVKLLALGGGAVMTIVELRLGIQNLQVSPPVAKLSVISYNRCIKTYIQN